ncbi:MAG TPA: hypothetical protein VG939_05390 [Caulobacteraceae bacterium]|nr:hypothetical protein [Caulobacteraceae bacterium]
MDTIDLNATAVLVQTICSIVALALAVAAIFNGNASAKRQIDAMQRQAADERALRRQERAAADGRRIVVARVIAQRLYSAASAVAIEANALNAGPNRLPEQRRFLAGKVMEAVRQFDLFPAHELVDLDAINLVFAMRDCAVAMATHFDGHGGAVGPVNTGLTNNDVQQLLQLRDRLNERLETLGAAIALPA